MTDAGWYDDGSGRERWWDGTSWTEQFRDGAAPAAPAATAAAGRSDALRVFTGNGNGGSASLTVYPAFVEYEHNNYFVTVPLAMLGPLSYSKQQTKPYDSVSITGDIKFHCDNTREVYEYLKWYLARP